MFGIYLSCAVYLTVGMIGIAWLALLKQFNILCNHIHQKGTSPFVFVLHTNTKFHFLNNGLCPFSSYNN